MAEENTDQATVQGKKKKIMQWNDIKDTLLMREVLALGLLTHKPKSKERGHLWLVVATNLNAIEGFGVTDRAVRDRVTNLMKTFSTKSNSEIKASGESGSEPTEKDILIQNMIDVNKDTDLRQIDEKAQKDAELTLEKQKALDIRSTALETFKETKKRKNEEEQKESKTRRSSRDTLSFLDKKIELDKELKTRELEQKASAQKAQNDFQQMMMQQMQLFQQQSQRQSQQFQAMMVQQQNQTLALLQFLKKD